MRVSLSSRGKPIINGLPLHYFTLNSHGTDRIEQVSHLDLRLFMKNNMFSVRGLAFTGLALSLFIALPSYANTAARQAPRATPVGAEFVRSYDLAPKLTLVAKLAAQQSVMIKPEVSGKVDKILVSSNQVVKAGQPMVALDSNKANATLAEARAYLNDEKRKEREYTRLVKKNAITQTELNAQKASVDIANARLNGALADLSYLQINAPFDGTIGFISFSKGKMVSSGEELFSLDNLNKMRLDLQVPEKYLSQLNVGTKVSAQSRAWKQNFTGKITHINSRINESTLSVPVRVEILNPEKKLKPGMLMSATIELPVINQPIIPVQALEYSGTKRYVYVVSNGKVQRTEIRLGARIDDSIVVESGLEIGQQIVTEGLVNMRDGIAVDVIKDTQPTAQGAQ